METIFNSKNKDSNGIYCPRNYFKILVLFYIAVTLGATLIAPQIVHSSKGTSTANINRTNFDILKLDLKSIDSNFSSTFIDPISQTCQKGPFKEGLLKCGFNSLPQNLIPNS